MESLIHLIYASAATDEVDDQQLAALLSAARRTNAALGVTGMLLFADGTFFQVLEGEAQVVESLFARIGRDPRHAQSVLLICEPIEERQFADWTMGFSRISMRHLDDIVGLNDFFGRKTCLGQLDEGRARTVLEAFAEGRWRVRLKSTTPELLGAGAGSRA